MSSGIQLVAANSSDFVEPTQPRWYLAYGSNLSATGFVVKRNITPLAMKVVIVDSLVLTFDNPGVPFIEPRFANCRLADSPTNLWTPEQPWTGEGSLMGVAYLLEPSDFITILRSEGGGTSYQPLLVPAVVLSSAGERTSEVIHAFTLLTPKRRAKTGYPSLRYMNLLRNGAKEQKMPEQYISYLESIPSYRIASNRQKWGRSFHLSGWMPILLLFFRLVARTSGNTGTAPVPIRWMRGILFGFMWTTYDCIGRWIFGDGEASN